MKVVYSAQLRTPYGVFTSCSFDSLEEAVVHLAWVVGRVWPHPHLAARILRIVDRNTKEAKDVLPEAHKRISEAIEKAKREGKRGRRK